MAQPREKPSLKNTNHLDRSEQDDAAPATNRGKKAELFVFDFSDDAGNPAENGGGGEPEQSPRATGDKTSSPRDEKASPRGPAAEDRSPRSDQGSPRKGENQLKVTERGGRRPSPHRNGYV